jgi:hypothetical protein
LEEESSSRKTEIPQWMFDPGVCCVMQQCEMARVSVDALRRVKELLERGMANGGSEVVEHQHSYVKTKGVADGKNAEPLRDATGSVPASSERAGLGDTAGERPEQGGEITGQSVDKPSRRKTSPQRGKGG